jgi:putative DNA primase/helicase
MEECTQYSEEDTESTMLYLSYAGWSQKHKQERVSKIEFSRRLSKMGYTNHRENEIDKITGKINCNKKVTYWDNIQIKPAEKKPSGQDEGRDETDTSCPKNISQPSTKSYLKNELGQDLNPFVDSIKKINPIKCDNIEDVANAKSSKNENPANNRRASCPKMRFFDSGEYGQDVSCGPVQDPVLEQKTLISEQQEESNSGNILSVCELMRTDLKNFARSKYNLIVDNLPVFVGDFNKEFPGYKQKYGVQVVLDNAERLSSRGWR